MLCIPYHFDRHSLLFPEHGFHTHFALHKSCNIPCLELVDVVFFLVAKCIVLYFKKCLQYVTLSNGLCGTTRLALYINSPLCALSLQEKSFAELLQKVEIMRQQLSVLQNQVSSSANPTPRSTTTEESDI